MKLIFIVLGLFLFAMGLWAVIGTLRCRVAVQAVLEEALPTGSTEVKRYAPVFRYEVEGKEYRGACLQSFPGQVLRRRYLRGQSYTVYVDPAAPGRFVLRRLPQATHWVMAVLGILLIVSAVR